MVRWHRLVTRWHVRVALDADVLQVDVGHAWDRVVDLDDGDDHALDRHGDGEGHPHVGNIMEFPFQATRKGEDCEREDFRVLVAADDLVACAYTSARGGRRTGSVSAKQYCTHQVGCWPGTPVPELADRRRSSSRKFL